MLTGTSGRDNKDVVILLAVLVHDPVADSATARTCPWVGHPPVAGVGEPEPRALGLFLSKVREILTATQAWLEALEGESLRLADVLRPSSA